MSKAHSVHFSDLSVLFIVFNIGFTTENTKQNYRKISKCISEETIFFLILFRDELI
jgi:hypothetical protein